MAVTASNALGSASRAFRLVVGDQLCLTPPMGWNSWGGHMFHIRDTVMRMCADIMVKRGLADVGFHYVSIDDGWPLSLTPVRCCRGDQAWTFLKF